jgi:hypothetical protein
VIKINREWAMPNKNTFSIKPINFLISSLFVEKGLMKRAIACDPFVNKSPFADRCLFTNDLDTAIDATAHVDAIEFLKGIEDNVCDIVLFDPPYSPRQVSECYKKMGHTVNMATTQSSYWGNLKKEVARITKIGGTTVTCGWNSGGIGHTLGFEIVEILLVPHGGWHNDTIVTVETKVK